jgi:hypothetical protein
MRQLWLMLIFLAFGCAHAQDGSGISVIVIPYEDSQVDSSHFNSVNKNLNTLLMDQFARKNFRVIPWENLGVDSSSGSDLNMRFDKQTAIALAKAGVESGDPDLAARALVVYKVNFVFHPEEFNTKVKIEIFGEVHDLETKRFIGEFSDPTGAGSVTLSRDCAQKPNCTEMELRKKARDIAIVVANQGARKLHNLTSNSDSGSSGGLVNTLQFRFENFSMDQVLALKSEIDNKWPGKKASGMADGGDGLATFNYVTTAPQEKIVAWTYQAARKILNIPRNKLDIRFTRKMISVSYNGSTIMEDDMNVSDEYR